MSETAVATANASQTLLKQPKREKITRITGKVRTAIDAMVWEGLKRDQAAQAAGLKDNSLYVALSRPDVKAYYAQQLDVLRTSERARNIHTLAEVRDQTSNQMARVQAVKALEQIDEEQPQRAAQQTAGMVIVVVNQAPTERGPVIDGDCVPMKSTV